MLQGLHAAGLGEQAGALLHKSLAQQRKVRAVGLDHVPTALA